LSEEIHIERMLHSGSVNTFLHPFGSCLQHVNDLDDVRDRDNAEMDRKMPFLERTGVHPEMVDCLCVPALTFTDALIAMEKNRKPKTLQTARRGERLLLGAMGGIIGTWAMTVAAQALYRRLPEREKYPLPPREITQVVLKPEFEPSPETFEDQALAVKALAAHFAYGAACGTLFTLAGMHESQAVARGMAYGVGVWAVSYLALMPALRILEPATRHPLRRNALMLSVHLVWGGILGLSSRSLDSSLAPLINENGRVIADAARSI
jgi:uncharacterized membrane protein YagU involved in acid resistance